MISTLRLLLKAESECLTARMQLPIVALSRNESNHTITGIQIDRYGSTLKSNRCLEHVQHTHLLSRRDIWYCSLYASSRNFGISKSLLTENKKQAEENPEHVSENKCNVQRDLFGTDSKLGLFAKFKLMYKKYWYVLIPVHVSTSIGWLVGFYYLSKCGVDLPAVLHYIHLSESVIEKAQNSAVAHYAIAYICYKVATPLRYAVSLGGATVSIKYLVQAGYIKPIPSRKELMQMYTDKRAIRVKIKEETKLESK